MTRPDPIVVLVAAVCIAILLLVAQVVDELSVRPTVFEPAPPSSTATTTTSSLARGAVACVAGGFRVVTDPIGAARRHLDCPTVRTHRKEPS